MNKALRLSVAFIFSSYIAYLLVGLGLTLLIDVSSLSFLFHKLTAALSIVVGLLYVRDGYCVKSVMEVPHSWRPRLVRMLRNITGVKTAILTGFVVTLL